MIYYLKGNIFDCKAENLVNAVNTVGVMGKGIALEFRNRFPENYKIYKTSCDNNELKIGTILIVKESNDKTIINFPTKVHWKDTSKYEYISEGLKALAFKINDQTIIRSIAIPALGCGLGGLKWIIVKELIENELSTVDADIYVYEPQ